MQSQIREHIRAVEAAERDCGKLEQIARLLIEGFERGGTLYLMGNGGSAADAQHIAAELVGRFKQNRKPLPAIALTTDTSTLTALSNDFGFEHVFERQIQALATSGDIVWALSVSGKSPNIVRGLQAARTAKATTIGFTGAGRNEFDSLCDLCLRVEHTSSDRVQEVHQLAYHLVCEAVENHFAGT